MALRPALRNKEVACQPDIGDSAPARMLVSDPWIYG